MKRLRALAILALGAFLLFAPPGTLIVIAVLIAGWFGWEWAALTALIVACALGAGWIVVRGRRGR
jgi:hypothetical protein